VSVFQHPAAFLFLGAVLALLSRGKLRKIVLLASPALALYAVSMLTPDAVLTHSIPGFTLELLRVDRLSRFFAIIFCIASFLGTLYQLHLDDAGEPVSSLALAGGALGVVFAGDWLTMFVFWEAMTVASLFVIWFARTPGSHRAGLRYLFIHVVGGGTLFAGILLHWGGGGDTFFGPMTGPAGLSPAGWLILTGVCVNAAVPPLHTWLTDAYPECSVTGSVVQSAFTTKTAVFVLLRAFPGAEPLAVLGTVMAVYGVIYAVMSNDIRRLLAYHIVSQVGFMVAGIGLGTTMSMDGAAAHAFCHILYKALLFMGAGAIVHAAGTGKLTELGGLWRKMPVTMILFMIGAFSISGLPPFNGFISKSITLASAGEAHRPLIELFLELASVGTFLSIGLKLAYFAFLGTDRDITPKPLPPNMVGAMFGAAALCTLLGVFPGVLYDLLPLGTEYHPYTSSHVLSSLQLHIGTAAGFWLLLKLLWVRPYIALDVDWLYRKPFPAVLFPLVRGMRAFGGFFKEKGVAAVYSTVPGFMDVDAKRMPVGMALFWGIVFLSALALYSWNF